MVDFRFDGFGDLFLVDILSEIQKLENFRNYPVRNKLHSLLRQLVSNFSPKRTIFRQASTICLDDRRTRRKRELFFSKITIEI